MEKIPWHQWLKENRSQLYGTAPTPLPEAVKSPSNWRYWLKNSAIMAMCGLFFYEFVKYFSVRRAEQLKEFAIVVGMLVIAMVVYKILKKEKVIW